LTSTNKGYINALVSCRSASLFSCERTTGLNIITLWSQ